MITNQPVNNNDDLYKVTDNVLRDAGMSIQDSGGKVTFAGKEPVRKTTMKAGAATGTSPQRQPFRRRDVQAGEVSRTLSID